MVRAQRRPSAALQGDGPKAIDEAASETPFGHLGVVAIRIVDGGYET